MASRICNCVNCNGENELPQSTAFDHEQQYGIVDNDLSVILDDTDSDPDIVATDLDDVTTISSSQIDRGSDQDGDNSNLREDVEEYEEDDATMAIEHLSRQLLELVSDRLITEKGVELSLKIIKQYVEHIFPESDFSEVLPTTYYMLKKFADTTSTELLDASSGSDILDVCVNECCVYERELANATSCPTCGESRSSERQMLVFDVLGRLRSMWDVPQMRELFKYPVARHGPGENCGWV